MGSSTQNDLWTSWSCNLMLTSINCNEYLLLAEIDNAPFDLQSSFHHMSWEEHRMMCSSLVYSSGSGSQEHSTRSTETQAWQLVTESLIKVAQHVYHTIIPTWANRLVWNVSCVVLMISKSLDSFTFSIISLNCDSITSTCKGANSWAHHHVLCTVRVKSEAMKG